MICLSSSILQDNFKRGSLFITVGNIIISREIDDKLYLLSEKDCFFAFERRLTSCRGSMILGLGCSVLLCSGACAALGRSGRLLGYWAFAFSLSCMTVSVASREGGPRSLEVVASVFLGFFALELDISEAIYCAGVGDGSFLSFFSYFRAIWFGLRLSCDWSFPLRVLFSHNCIFVLLIFNKLMKNKKENSQN